MGVSVNHLEVIEGGGSCLVVQKQTQGIPFHGVDIEGDDWDATDCFPKTLLPPVPPPVEVDKLGGKVVVGETSGQRPILSTELALWSIGLEPCSQGGVKCASLKSGLWLILRKDNILLVGEVAG